MLSKATLVQFNYKPLSRSNNLPTNTRSFASQLNPSIRDALRSKSLARLLITYNFYTTRLIRLIHLCLVLYSLLRSCKEPLTTLRLARNQYVNRTKYESIEVHSQETIENETLTNRYKTHVQYTTKTLDLRI